MTRHEEPLFNAIVRIDRLPAAGRTVEVELDESSREKLATELKLTAVDAFFAKLSVVPLRGGLRAQGHLTASIVQPSVVSFEPVAQDIAEDIDRVFLPQDSTAKAPTPGSEVFIDLEDEDFPDHIDGPEVDLSALLVETLALAIDPYPRLPNEDINSLGLNDDAAASGPFAGLAKLKKP